jgi:hypothetical protein
LAGNVHGLFLKPLFQPIPQSNVFGKSFGDLVESAQQEQTMKNPFAKKPKPAPKTIDPLDSIRTLLEPYTQLPLECDGLTRVFVHLLKTASIPHSVFVGTIDFKGKRKFYPHFWIKLASGEIVDYRSRMWLGEDKTDKTIPQGIFKEDPKIVSYEGEEISLPVGKTVFEILTRGYSPPPKA